jgi:hypothetical protein
MQYSDQALQEAVAKERILYEFFLNVKAALRTQGPVGQNSQLWSEDDKKLHKALQQAQGAVHLALMRNLDYPTAMSEIFGT